MIMAVKTNLLLLCCITMSSFLLQGNDKTFAYIEQYKTIVINEMSRTGIPASIKMAQAILESSSGESTLARQSNNHFGIKCGSSWTGEEVYRHDDDYKDGLLVRSCFRAYDNPEESFIAHSDFLANPNSSRYGFLFDLDRFDYKAWARGLKKAGYATDPNYSKKLISIIEKYNLFLLDLEAGSDEGIFASTSTQRIKEQHVPEDKRPVKIQVIRPKQIESRYALRNGFYTFKLGDRMNEIAAHYRMDIKELYFRNRLPFGVTPLAGEKIAIRKYIHFKDVPEYHKSSTLLEDEDYLFTESITLSSR